MSFERNAGWTGKTSGNSLRTDAFERRRRFGKVQPMHEPSWLERLIAWARAR